MSGPLAASDLPATAEISEPGTETLEVIAPRDAVVGTVPVRRSLPRRERRTVGAWCFLDQMGPVTVTEKQGMNVAPHPHIGLQTVTWLLSGEVVHRDSLGSEQLIRPGELNLMAAGRGVSHSEERTDRTGGQLHGVQLWVAQPEATRHGPAWFEHHSDLPVGGDGSAQLTVLLGEVAGLASPGHADTELVGVDVRMGAGTATIPLRSGWEHAVVALSGGITVDGRFVAEGEMAYMGTERDGCRLSARDEARALLIGGPPFPEPVLMWWNYVARSRDEISEAHREWTDGSERFGQVASKLPRVEVGPPPWSAT